MKVEQVSCVLSMVTNQLVDMGALHISANDERAVKVQFRDKEFKDIPGDIVVSRRQCEQYPYQLSKFIMGVEFFCITSEVPNETID
ncbi:hypothetical protein [Sporomusa malonica]|uniref:Uncharacterized protein n=1 Tax=Sporomusa malonica TaxID=112901 RepID=A0A1W2AU39_9FIRM|nr:hypothetical protein [Sporomusa malonica]SMC64206.1 hypothetical protein SAMN04488500_106120 [Sporomusa malonica]